MRRNSHTRGSAIVWAMAVTMILTIFVTAVLSIALAFVTRSIRQNAQKQAYFTARSAIDTLAGEISRGLDQGTALVEKLKEQPDGVYAIDRFPFPEDMGTCAVTMTYTEEEIAIRATAEYRGEKRTVTGYLVGHYVSPADDGLYGSGLYATTIHELDEDGTTIAYPYTLRRATFGGGQDVYIRRRNEGIVVRGEDAPIWFPRNLLSYGKVEIISGADASGSVSIGGEIVAAGNVTLSGSAVTVGSAENPGGIYAQGTVKLTGNAVVYGDITADSVTLQDDARLIGNVYTRSGTATVKGRATWSGSGETIELIPTRLPRMPDFSFFTEMSQTMSPLPWTSMGGAIIGNTDGSNAYYEVTAGNQPQTALQMTTQGSGNNFILVRSGATLDLLSLKHPGTNTPHTYIYLEKGAQLNLGMMGFSTVIQAYIYGEPESVTVAHDPVEIQGGFMAGILQYDYDEKGIQYQYIPPVNAPALLPEVGGAGARGGWYLARYEDNGTE